MIGASSVSFSYGDRLIINDLSLQVPAGSTYAIVGRTGCGKSTLLHLLAGILEPDSGSVAADVPGRSNDAAAGSRRRATAPRPMGRSGTSEAGDLRTALVLQDGGLFPWKRIVDNVALGLLAQRRSGTTRASRRTEAAAAKAAALAQLDRLGLSHRAHAFPADVSGGERQRAALARALVTDPSLLLADEFASSLDVVTREEIQDLLLRSALEAGRTLVVVTHSVDEAVALGATIGVMRDGQIATEIRNPTLRANPDRYSPEFTQVAAQVRKALAETGRPESSGSELPPEDAR